MTYDLTWELNSGGPVVTNHATLEDAQAQLQTVVSALVTDDMATYQIDENPSGTMMEMGSVEL